MPFWKLFFNILVFLLLSFRVFSQPSKKEEVRDVYLPVTSLYSHGDSLFAVIKGGKELGIKNKTRVKCFSINYYEGGREVRENKEVGFAFITEVFADSAVCFVNLNNKGSLIDSLWQGDLVEVSLTLPVQKWKNIFYDLALINIFYGDFNKDLFYDLPYLLKNNSSRTEDSLKKIILKDIRYTYQLRKDRLAGKDERLLQPLKENGQFKGRIPFEILRDADEKDVHSYLLYVMTYPAGYMGHNYRASESFIGWIVSNSPFSSAEVKKVLLPLYKNKAALQQLLPLYRYSILSENAGKSYAEEALELNEKKKYKEANELIGFALAITNAVNDTFGKAHVYLERAQMNINNENYIAAIKDCDSAIIYAVLKSDRKAEIRALLKTSWSLFNLSKYTEAKSSLKTVEVKVREYERFLGKGEFNFYLQRRNEYAGRMSYRLGDYSEAISFYEKAIELNKTINTHSSLVDNAELYKLFGQIKSKQGNNDEAKADFTRSLWLYDTVLHDEPNTAKVLYELAGINYSLANYRQAIRELQNAFTSFNRLDDPDYAGYSKSVMGNCYWKLGQIDSAVDLHTEAVKLQGKSSNRYGAAYSWDRLGELYRENGFKKNALLAFKESAGIYNLLGDYSSLADNYNNTGLVYHKDENYKLAVTMYDEALVLNRRSNSSFAIVNSNFNLGLAWLELDTAKARMYLLQAEKKSDSTKNTVYQFDALKYLSYLAYRNNEQEAGDLYFQRALLLNKEIYSPERKARLIDLRGDRSYYSQQLDSALYYYIQSLAIYDTVSKSDACWELNAIANVYISKGNFEKAITLLQRAVLLADSIGNKLAWGYSLQAASFLYAELGEFAKGMAANDSAAAIFKESGNNLRLANTYVSRGSLLKGMGKYKESIDASLQADKIYREEGTEYYRFNSLNSIGVTYYNQNDYANAVKYFKQSAGFLKPGILNEEFLLNRSNIAESYYFQKKPDTAEKILLEVYPLAVSKNFNRVATGMAIALGRIYFDANQLNKAAEYFRQAKESSDRSGAKEAMIDALIYLGKIDNQSGNNHVGEQYLKQAAAVASRYGIASKGWEPYYELGLYYYQQKKYDSAIGHFVTAVDIVENNAKNIYGGKEALEMYKKDYRKADLFAKIVSSYAAMGNKEKVAEYTLRNNAAAINDKFGSVMLTTNDPATKKVYNEYVAKQQQIKVIDESISRSTNENQRKELLARKTILAAGLQHFLDSLTTKYPELSSFTRGIRNLEKYKGKIPPEAAAILYLINDNELIAIIITRKGLEVKTTTLTEDINSTINEFISMLTIPEDMEPDPVSVKKRTGFADEINNPAGLSFTDVSQKLYGLLIEGILPELEVKGNESRKLCIIPNGKLTNIPFQCLGKGAPGKGFRYLTDDYSVFYSYDIDVFSGEKSTEKNLSQLMAFGNPDTSLIHAATEVKAIGKIVSSTTVFTEKKATESLAKSSLSGKKYIHFATHGSLDYIHPKQSYLLFAKQQGSDDDGHLTIGEVDSLSIENCELVTLSACETAITQSLDTVVKDWYVSPTVAFINKNVKSVVASLWKVNDEATSILMTEFYKNLNAKDRKMDKVDALRKAQETVRKNSGYSHPYYWGAFVLYGDWR